MRSPPHMFWLLSDDELRELHLGGRSPTRWPELLAHPTRLKLEDDLVHYLADTLAWAATENPANPQSLSGTGLNLFGPTIVSGEGARKLARILRAWCALLAEGPPLLALRGLWETTYDNEGHEIASGYGRIEVERDELVATLAALAGYAERSADGPLTLLHVGL